MFIGPTHCACNFVRGDSCCAISFFSGGGCRGTLNVVKDGSNQSVSGTGTDNLAPGCLRRNIACRRTRVAFIIQGVCHRRLRLKRVPTSIVRKFCAGNHIPRAVCVERVVRAVQWVPTVGPVDFAWSWSPFSIVVVKRVSPAGVAI